MRNKAFWLLAAALVAPLFALSVYVYERSASTVIPGASVFPRRDDSLPPRPLATPSPQSFMPGPDPRSSKTGRSSLDYIRSDADMANTKARRASTPSSARRRASKTSQASRSAARKKTKSSDTMDGTLDSSAHKPLAPVKGSNFSNFSFSTSNLKQRTPSTSAKPLGDDAIQKEKSSSFQIPPEYLQRIRATLGLKRQSQTPEQTPP